MPSTSTSDDLSCYYAAFRADDVPVNIVPSFDYSSKIPLLSSTAVGPFKAGMTCTVPIWFALTLRQRSLCSIQQPDWLTSENLVEIIAMEKQSRALFTDSSRLPPAYYEIAKRLTQADSNNSNTSSSGAGAGDGKSVALLVQDLLSIRLDKLRQQFQGFLSDLSDQTALTVDVNGIGTQELAILQRFVRQALNDQNYLLVGNSNTNSNTNTASGAEGSSAGNMSRIAKGEKEQPIGATGPAAGNGVGGSGGEGDETGQGLPAVRARVPLRRFRR
jgi:hypothetical protein